MDSHYSFSLCLARHSTPHWPESRDRIVQTLLLLLAIVIGVDTSSFMPKVVIGEFLPSPSSSEPFSGSLFRIGRSSRSGKIGKRGVRRFVGEFGTEGERGEREFFDEIEFVVEVFVNDGSDIDFVFVEEGAEVDRTEVRTSFLESISRVVTRFSDSSIVKEVVLERLVVDFSGVVSFDELVDTDAELFGIRCEDTGEVRRLRLGRDTLSVGSVARESSNFVKSSRFLPNDVILLNRSLNRTFEPCLVLLGSCRVELSEDSEGEIGKEGRLRAHEVVRTVSIENLLVVLDLEEEVLDDTFGEVDVSIGEKSE